MKNILSWIRDILIAVVIAAIILAFFKPITVQQESKIGRASCRERV